MKHAAVGNWEPFSCSLQLTVLSDLLAKLLHLWQGLSACAAWHAVGDSAGEAGAQAGGERESVREADGRGLGVITVSCKSAASFLLCAIPVRLGTSFPTGSKEPVSRWGDFGLG